MKLPPEHEGGNEKRGINGLHHNKSGKMKKWKEEGRRAVWAQGGGLRKERGRGETRASVKMNNCGNDGDEGSRKGTSLGWNITGHFVQWISQVDLHAYMTGNFGLEVSNTNCLFVSQRTGSHSAGIHVPFTNCFVCRWFCVVHDPKTPLHSHNWLSFDKFQDTERFLSHCERHFSSVTTTP